MAKTKMTNKQPPTIKGIEKELDKLCHRDFVEPPTIKEIADTFDVCFSGYLGSKYAENKVKNFLLDHIEEILKYLEGEELNAERELGWGRKDFEEALDTSDDYRELGEFDSHNQAVKELNAKIKKVRS